MRRRTRAAVLLATLGLSVSWLVSPTPSAAQQASTRPNVLLLVADDEPSDMFSRTYMPGVFSQIVDQGIRLDRAYVSSSLCCPSRSQILTGLTEPRTGVDENTIGLTRPTLPMALHDGGYRTAMIGKYLNSWNCDARPEFDRWACVASGQSSYTLVNPFINDDGSWAQRTGYQPDLLADRVINFIQSTPADQPFFAMYTPTTPHLPANGNKYSNLVVPPARAPSYDEETRTPDHPMYLRSFPLTASKRTSMDNQHRTMGRATRALDDSMTRILAALGSRAEDTLVIFISDNGYHYGEHRRWEKASPFEESMRVPMAIRFPSQLATGAAFASDALVSNIDIAPTIADAVGFPWHADGTSLLPLIAGNVPSVHDALLLSRCMGIKLLTEPCRGLGWYPSQETVYPSYAGVVTETAKLIRYPLTNEEQLFDLVTDPWEMHNLAGDPAVAGLQSSLEAQLAALLAPPPIDTTIVSGPSAPIADRVASFRYFSPPRASTYRCRLTRDGNPGAWFDCNGEQTTIGGLVDGDYVFEVAGSHLGSGTDATPAARSFSVHSSGPAVTLTNTPAAAQRSRSASLSFTSPAANATFSCRASKIGGPAGTWSPCNTGTVSYTNLEDGLWNFEVRATANGETTSPAAAWLTRVDNIGPTWVIEARPPSVTGSGGATLTFAPLEALGGVITCKRDSQPAVACSSGSFAASGLAAGSHTITIASTDDLGNASTQKISWNIDRTPPTVSITKFPAASATTPSFTFAATGGTSVFLCTLDAWAPTPCHATQSMGVLAPGAHTLAVRSIDKSFNQSAPVSYSWTITG